MSSAAVAAPLVAPPGAFPIFRSAFESQGRERVMPSVHRGRQALLRRPSGAYEACPVGPVLMFLYGRTLARISAPSGNSGMQGLFMMAYDCGFGGSGLTHGRGK
jgi:hypothetical protein